MKKGILILVFMQTLLFAGCASVFREDGIENLAADEIAVLETMLEFANQHKVTVTQIEGRNRGAGSITRYELKPGEHTVDVSLVSGIAKPATLKFLAKKGATYRLQHKFDGSAGIWSVSIVSNASGEVVSQVDVPFRRVAAAARAGKRAGWVPGSLPQQ